MQQPYAAQAREQAPRAVGRRLARRDAVTDITVISFRQPAHQAGTGHGEPSWTLDHRVLVRGHRVDISGTRRLTRVGRKESYISRQAADQRTVR